MTTKTTFEDEFTSLCELLGEDYSTLIHHFGQYDDIYTNDYGTRFMYYNNIKTDFLVDKKDAISSFKVPIADAIGHKSFENPKYYSINGIHQGMTHDEVREIMGEPDIKSNRGDELDDTRNLLHWNYSSNIGYTKSGNKYIIRYMFEDIADEDMDAEFILGEFHIDLLEKYTPPVVRQTNTKSGGCFVATACYGDYDAAEVLVLRNYRDNVLLKTNLGRIAVDIYYFISPPIARLLDKSESLKAFIRKNILAPIVSKIKKNQ